MVESVTSVNGYMGILLSGGIDLADDFKSGIARTREGTCRALRHNFIGVLAADQADAVQRNFGLDGERHAGCERCGEALGQNRGFVHRQADGVTEKFAGVHESRCGKRDRHRRAAFRRFLPAPRPASS